MTDRFQMHAVQWMVPVLLALVLHSGCTRSRYRVQADREANYLVREKSLGTPWEVPDSFTIEPDSRSRFYDPTDRDYPTLPPAGPQLYEYELSELSGTRSGRGLTGEGGQPETLPAAAPDRPDGQSELPTPPIPDGVVPSQPSPSGESPSDDSSASGPGVGTRIPVSQPGGGDSDTAIQLTSHVSHPMQEGVTGITDTGQVTGTRRSRNSVHAAAWQSEPEADAFETFMEQLEESRYNVEGIELPAVQPRFWEDVPPDCLELMLDFESVRREYSDTYGRSPSPSLRDQSPRATLPDLFNLAVINSREYQRQKEILYQAALDVALERYAYATKFSVRGSTVDTTFTHSRTAGTTVNSLSAPSTLAGNKTLATGGTLVGEFANQVLLTFNGPTGFAADVSSELLFEITQRVFQRDVRLESLIQSERDLVYAARDFARFRKSFFLDIAESYYGILRGYRQIEISAQNYFDQVLTFQRALQEQESEISDPPSMIDVNQFERSTLNGLSSLIADCNDFQDQLDRIKVLIGIPTETRMNIDLRELQQLTLRDVIEVNRERSSRWLRRLENLRDADEGETDRTTMLAADYSLAERLSYWLWQRGEVAEAREVFKKYAMFRLDAARSELNSERGEMGLAGTGEQERDAGAENEDMAAREIREPIIKLWHQLDVLESELELINRQIRYAEAMGIRLGAVDNPRDRLKSYQQQFQEELDLESLFAGEDGESPESSEDVLQIELSDESIRRLGQRATGLLSEAETLSRQLDNVLFGQPIKTVPLQEILDKTDNLSDLAKTSLNEAKGGLPSLDISVDEAMVTALVQRLDLMNRRGTLADNWRAIKIAADELKSNLNVGASQRIGTDTNRPFSFSADNASTQLRLSCDLPLNRKAERNAYRRALINYNAELRNLMEFKDNIKLNVRTQIRDLAQARIRYPIFVAQAAVAEEQVLNTQLQLISGLEIRALELLQAYSAARNALGSMVDARINYIVQRARFALELEAMMLDDTGYWPRINDPGYQPEPDVTYPETAGSAYGTFPSYLKVSREYQRMLNYPPPANHQRTAPTSESEAEEAASGEENG